MVEPSHYRGIGLAVLAVGLVVGSSAFLASGGTGSAPLDSDVRLPDVERSSQPELELLGASGVLPTMSSPSPAQVATLVVRNATVAPGAVTIPPMVLDAYLRTERVLAQRSPGCGLQWPLLAGLGRVVSDHARGGSLDQQGTTSRPILGPRLDGGPGLPELTDTDDGRLDGDSIWDRAAGPMQIIPAVWQRVGADSDRDGSADPHNIYDATLAAGRYLCGGGADLRTPGGQVRAVFRYQRSEPFVRTTMLWARAYGATPALPSAGPRLPAPESVTLDENPPPPAELPGGPTSAPISGLSTGSAPPGSTPAPPPPRQGPGTPPPSQGTPSPGTPPPDPPTTGPPTTGPPTTGPPTTDPPTTDPPTTDPPTTGPPTTGPPTTDPPPDPAGEAAV
ncbi:MAG: lytic transglycosylase [Pseudonocardiaceae bacterium]|nr:lytic transglycosylase [Pseudonocardiaceae bacterium]